MLKTLSLIVGGTQGEGVISTGTNLMRALSRQGYFTFSKRNFSSRIKGGNTTIHIQISTDRVMAVKDAVEILLAFDVDTIKRHREQLQSESLIIFDSSLEKHLSQEGLNIPNYLPLPLTQIAKEAGTPILKTTVALGLLGFLLGIEEGVLQAILKRNYNKKGPELLEKNKLALEKAYILAQQQLGHIQQFTLANTTVQARPLMMGNDAISIGALIAGCRFVASYPITPASEIMENLGKLLPQYQGAMLQVEDEIAAINMIIGAAYGGVRSMTATSGPGISLMMEGIGLAAMTETPIVIVDAQRAGPSTGLPTKHEQSDLAALYYGGHGEFPIIILSPSTVEECFETTARAFNLAERYQCPVIILSDLALSLSLQTVEPFHGKNVTIDRGKLLDTLEPGKPFGRFSFTADSISPRVLPGTPGGTHHITGLEHNEKGYPSDDPMNRKKMMEKRLQKLLPLEEGKEINVTDQGNKYFFLSYGSTYGVLREAVTLTGNSVDYGHIAMIKPLPKKQLLQLLAKYDQVIILENNYSQQLASIIKAELGYHHKIKSFNRFDGTPFTLEEIIKEIGGLIHG